MNVFLFRENGDGLAEFQTKDSEPETILNMIGRHLTELGITREAFSARVEDEKRSGYWIMVGTNGEEPGLELLRGIERAGKMLNARLGPK